MHADRLMTKVLKAVKRRAEMIYTAGKSEESDACPEGRSPDGIVPLRFALIVGVMLLSVRAAAVESDRIEFNRDIRPILAGKCFECHGFDAQTRRADLRLDTREGALADNNGTRAVIPEDIRGSELWNRITSTDADLVMPPPESKKTLSEEEKTLLRRWIEQGAQYQKHWAFEVPVRTAVPEVPGRDRVRNPVDAFILKKLGEKGMQPAPEAGRETLIRRVSFVLTGLPPRVSEVDEYLADTSDTAYESMVNRYLDSPHYGEEQARHWLDVARYADTHGLHLDNEREMWSYRDWVIRAFNENLPFDQFTVWQLAGDLLPEPTQDQKTATGFNRCNVTTSEGGAIADEWLYRYAVDRTSTAMQTWMGLTAGCAVCHDHKYDPITMRDFYSMYAFFYSTSDPAMDGNIRNTSPFLKVPSTEQRLALEKAQTLEAKSKRELEDALKSTSEIKSDDRFSEQGQEHSGDDSADAESAKSGAGYVEDIVFDDAFPKGSRTRNTSRDDAVWLLDPEFGVPSGRRVLQLAFGGPYDLTLEPTLIPVMTRAGGQLQFWMRTDAFNPPSSVTLTYDDGRSHRIVWGNEGGGGSVVAMGSLPTPGEWTHIVIPFEKAGSSGGQRIRSISLAHTGGKLWVDQFRITGETEKDEDPLSSFEKWWQTGKGQNPVGLSGDLQKVFAGGPTEAVTQEQRRDLFRFWQMHVQRVTESPFPELKQRYLNAAEEVTVIDGTIPGTLVFSDLATPRTAHIMLRGQYDRPGDEVLPDVPVEFPELKDAEGRSIRESGRRATRLDLARWFVSTDNPLTARVTVNRFWQQVFGTGLVKTSDDFGTRGDLPSHPELLDWLATYLMEQNWDVKNMFRLLLTSSTFRQQSSVGEQRHQLDPENRMLARGPRFRLDAEQLRDNSLFTSGLMDLTMGGRGVLPYQPADIWEPVGYENSNTRFYLQDHGASLYRRSVYCFLKRTAPPPFMSNFDAPNREQFCSRRERSNTPLQALQLMNDVQHFEAARALAERALLAGGGTTEQRIQFLFRTVLSRFPDPDEVKWVAEGLSIHLTLFEADPAAAAAVVRSGESSPTNVAPTTITAAWTMVASLILNLDETVVRN